ncbi:MAG: triose-phosphate isomerase [Chloroflexi bacterium]|nr:triose-phosphate isomerase [Chloroflexota bacterium]
MRVPIIAGNWKMNTNIQEALTLVDEMLSPLDGIKGVEKVLCPPFVSLQAVGSKIAGTSVRLGAQNMYFQEKGAYTGEISPAMLAGLCHYVILGHSERRQHFGETDELVNRKVQAAVSHKLVPVICVGESLAQNEEGLTNSVVRLQVKAALQGLSPDDVKNVVFAYEPIWAIGTGKAATGQGANAVIGLIRATVAGLYDRQTAQGLRIQYGGSVTATNIAEFIRQPEIDGALVGGASLKAEEFLRIVEQTARSKGTGTVSG